MYINIGPLKLWRSSWISEEEPCFVQLVFIVKQRLPCFVVKMGVIQLLLFLLLSLLLLLLLSILLQTDIIKVRKNKIKQAT